MAPARVTGAVRAVALAVAATAWTTAGAWLEAAKTDISVEFDKTFSFAGLRTWAWHPDGPGDVRLAVSASDDPKRVAARVDPVIIPAVERELGARGFRAAAERADLYVHYYVLVAVQQSAQYQGQFVAPVPEWGLPPFAPSTTALSIYPVGTLILDMTSPARQAIIWRGAAVRRVDIERPDAARRQVLERAIRDLLKRFPPKT
jgi:Domain of unknown function (DUF4136)